jgi:hypothetical protein
MTHLPSNFCECKPRLTILKPVKQLNLNNFYLIQLKLVTKQLGCRAALISDTDSFEIHGNLCSGCFFKFHLIVGVEKLIVNALYRLRITDQLFKSYVLHEWCVHNPLFNVYYEVKFKKTPDISLSIIIEYSFSHLLWNENTCKTHKKQVFQNKNSISRVRMFAFYY